MISNTKIDKAAKDMRHALVLQFLSKRPPINILRTQIIKTWKFTVSLRLVSWIDFMFSSISRMKRLFAYMGEGRTVVAIYQFKLFNLFVDFDIKKDSSFVA